MAWAPKVAPLMTKWSSDVNPNAPHPEYPRPQLVREEWYSLNGLWDFDIIEESDEVPDTLREKILVPFCVESALSGVMRGVAESQRMVYRRNFNIDAAWNGKRIKLIFQAVDYETDVLVNGRPVGTHTGGYDSFGFDITEYLLLGDGVESITVIVKDPTENKAIPLGKQWSGADKLSGADKFIFYTSSSGIWQSVWLEPVPEVSVEKLVITPDLDQNKLGLKILTTGEDKDSAQVTVLDGDELVVRKTLATDVEHYLDLGENLKKWSPDSPFLYDLKITLPSGDGVVSYFGMRKIEMKKDGEFQRIFLNNQELKFQLGPLDQGYWPDGILTPPTEKALKWDLEQIKRLGFNMVRKHIKVESERWYHWTDRLGLLVWQDFPSISDVHNPSGVAPEWRENFALQYRKWMEQRGNHPSIVLWVVFNEAWGQFDTVEVTKDVMSRDPRRLVTGASGWDDFPVGDILDLHVYPGPSNGGTQYAPAESRRAVVVGELWGQSKIPWGHCWEGDTKAKEDPRGGFTSDQLFLEAYNKSISELLELRDSRGYTAAVFTQLTDVEAELNGYFSYDRELAKVDIESLAEMHRTLLQR